MTYNESHKIVKQTFYRMNILLRLCRDSDNLAVDHILTLDVLTSSECVWHMCQQVSTSLEKFKLRNLIVVHISVSIPTATL
jgi:hypothetical protein